MSTENDHAPAENELTLAEALAQPDAPAVDLDFDFEPPRAGELFRPANLN